MSSRKDTVAFLKERPAVYARHLGFTKLKPMHNDWIRQMVVGHEDATMQAHRGSYKTTCVSVAIVICMILYPNDRILFMRKTDGDVKEVVRQITNILKNPITSALAEDIYDTNLRLTIENSFEVGTNLSTDIRGPSQLIGLGIGGSITGKHFERIFTDDIVNVKDRVSRAERERTILAYQELQNVRNRGGRIYNTGTPWHKEDAFRYMPNVTRYSYKDTGLIDDESLRKIKASMLPSLFAANYELKIIASEDVIFTEPQTGADISMVEQTEYCHIDAAYEGTDFTAFTMVRKAGGKYYVLGRLWRKHIDDVEDEIIQIKDSLNGGKIYCETNGDKGYLAKDLRKRGERVSTYHERMNKFLKITSYLKGVWRDVVFVTGTDEGYINQITDYNETAEHDDAPDSLASVIRLLWNKGTASGTMGSDFL